VGVVGASTVDGEDELGAANGTAGGGLVAATLALDDAAGGEGERSHAPNQRTARKNAGTRDCLILPFSFD
jgi:hypothetical protein